MLKRKTKTKKIKETKKKVEEVNFEKKKYKKKHVGKAKCFPHAF
jgi:hypothetical protein